MAITRYAGDRFVGLNEEKDSLLTKVMDGAIYITTDFDKQFIKKDGSWIRMGGICASGEVQNGMTTYDTGSECLLVESGIRFFGRTSDTGVADEGNYLIVSGNTSLGIYPEVDASGEPVDPQSVLRVIGDLRVEGDYGTLVEADSNITSSLFSVSDSAGLPVFEVFPDDRVVAGRYDQSDFIIDSSGNVGIGVTGEILSKFHFDSDSGKNDELLISAFEGQNAIVNISGTKVTAGPTGPIKTPIKWTVSGDYANSGHLKIRTESGVFVTLTNESGYLGLGTEEPEHTLHVSGDAQVSGYLYDVNNTTGQSGWVLTSESGGPVWRESSAGTIDGSGISGYLSVWEDQDTLGNSPVYQYGSNIGVDTTTVGAKLQVGGNNTLDTAILIDPVTGANNDRRWKFNAKSASDYLEIGSVSNTQIFVLDGANGSVGIGMIPQHALHVNGDAMISGYLYDSLNTTGQDGWVLTSKSGGSQWQMIEDVLSGVGGSGTANYVPLWQDEDTLTDSVIAQSGVNVGIGTDTPDVKLKIVSSGGSTVSPIAGTSLLAVNNAQASNNSRIGIIGGTTGFSILDMGDSADQNIGGIAYDNNANKLYLRANDNYFLTILSDGKVGIGTQIPSNLLHLSSSAPAIRFEDTDNADDAFSIIEDNNGNLKLRADASNASANTELGLEVDGSRVMTLVGGSVGIGINPPIHDFHVSGDAQISGYLYDYTNSTGQDGYVLTSRSGGPVWEEAGGGTLSGSGVANYSAKWDGETSLTSGIIYDDGTSIGIGTNAPQHTLHVNGNAIISGYLYDSTNSTGAAGYVLTSENNGPQWKLIEDVLSGVGGSGTANYVPLWEDEDTLTDSIIQQNGGCIGIGISPDAKLHVLNKIKIEGGSSILELKDNTDNDDHAIIFSDNNDNTVHQIRSRDHTTASPLGDMFFFEAVGNLPIGFVTNDEHRLTILGNGKVGVNIVSPTHQLHVSGDGKFNLESGQAVHLDGAGDTYLKVDRGSVSDNDAIISFDSSGTSDFRLGTLNYQQGLHVSGAELELFTIDNYGNVGVKTQKPLDGDLEGSPAVTINGTDPTININSSGQLTGSDGQAGRLRFTANDSIAGAGGTTQGKQLAEISAYYVGNTNNGDYDTDLIFKVAEGSNVPAEQLRITSSGQLKLDAYGQSSSIAGNAYRHLAVDSAGYVIQTSNSGTTNFLPRYYNNYGGLDNSVVQQDGNKIGINVAPEHQLHVSGDAIISGYLYDSTNSTGSAGYILSSEAGGPQWKQIEDVLSGVGGSGTANYVPLWQDEDTLTDSVIAQSGNYIGIGSDTPTAKLHVQDDSGLKVHPTTPTDDAHYIRLRHDNSTGTIDANRGDLKLDAQNYVYTLKNFGINATTPSNKLVVINSDTDTTPTALLQNSSTGDASLHFNVSGRSYTIGIDNSDDDKFKIARNNGLGTTDRLTINGDGNVGIGTTGPDTKLHIDAGAILLTDVITYSANQDSAYLIAGTSGYTGATTNWNTFGFQHRFKTSSGGVPRVTIDTSGGEKFYIDNNGRAYINNDVGIGTSPNTQIRLLVSGNMRVTTSAHLATTSGSVGIGSTAPTEKLFVLQGTVNSTIARFTGANTDRGLVIGTAVSGITNDSIIEYDAVSTNSVGQHAFKTDGTERVRISADGNVGIGTTSPTSTLNISDSTAGASVLKVDGSSGTIFEVTDDLSNSLMSVNTIAGLPVFEVFADYHIVAGRYNQNDFYLDTNGNLGLGTATPSFQLDVSGGLRIYQNTSSVGSGLGLTIENDGTGDSVVQFILTGVRRWVTGIDNSDSDKFKIASSSDLNSDARLTIQTDGKVGIGTTAPSYPLDIEHATAPTVSIVSVAADVSPRLIIDAGGGAGTADPHIKFDSNGVDWSVGVDQSDGDKFKFATSNGLASEKVVIQRDGNVGVGINDPESLFHVHSETNKTTAIISSIVNSTTGSYLRLTEGGESFATYGYLGAYIQYDGANNLIHFGRHNVNGISVSDDDPIITIKRDDGNLGINTIDPKHHLHVDGDAIISGYLYDSTNSTGVAGYVLASQAGGPQWQSIEDVLSGVGGGGTTNYIPKWDDPDTLGNSNIYEDSNGNIGINNTTPSGHLDIGGVLNDPPVIRLTNKTNSVSQNNSLGEIQFYNSDTTDFTPGVFGIIRGVAHASGGDGSIQILTDMPSEGTPPTGVTAHFNTDGKVGIGVIDPGSQLDVKGDIRVRDTDSDLNHVYLFSNSTEGVLRLSNGTNYGFIARGQGNNPFIGTHTSGSLNISGFTNSLGSSIGFTLAQFNFSTQRVGIGLQSPYGKLEVALSPTTSSTTVNETADFADKFVISNSGTSANGDRIPLVFNVGGAGGDNISAAIVGEREASGWNSALSFWVNNVTSGSEGTDAIQERMRINSDGYVGIGTDDPDLQLHVKSSSGNSNLLLQRESFTSWQISAGSTYLAFLQYGGSELLRIQNTGKVGIGTPSPEGELHVFSASAGTVTASSAADELVLEGSGDSGLTILSPDNKESNIFLGGPGLSYGGLLRWKHSDLQLTLGTNVSNSFIVFKTDAGTESVRITSDGHVGIGTTNPGTAKLYVLGGSSSQTFSTGADELVVEGSDHAGISILAAAAKRAQLYFNTDAFLRWVDNDGVFSIDTSSSASKIALGPSGANVGVGTNDPDVKLQVEDSAAGSNVDVLQLTNTSTDADSSVGVQFFSGNAQFAYIRGIRTSSSTEGILKLGVRSGGSETDTMYLKGGSVGIGIVSPQYKLDVAGTINSSSTIYAADVVVSGATPTITLNDTDGNANAATAFVQFQQGGTAIGKVGDIASGRSAMMLYADSGKALMFFTNGQNATSDTPAITINTSQNVGIGTVSPTFKLHVNGGGARIEDGETTLSPDSTSSTGTSTRALTIMNLVDSGWTTDALTAYNNTTSYDILNRASYSFFARPKSTNIFTHCTEVNGNAHLYRFVNLNSAATEPLLRWSFYQYDGSGTTSGDFKVANQLFEIQHNGSTQLMVKGDGNVGIGTDSPLTDLDVRNNIGVYGANSSTSGQIYLGSSDFTNSGYFNSAPGIGAIISTGDSQTNGLGFYTYTGASNSRTEKMRIEDDGKVGIGTTSPSYPLDVVGYVNSSIGFRAGNYTILNESGNETSLGNTAYYGVSFKTNNAVRMKIANAGNIQFNTYGSGSNTGTSTYYLTVDSSGNVIEELISSGTPTGSGTTNYIPKWNGAVSLTDSVIYEAGGNIGINQTTPANYKLYVSGTGTDYNNAVIRTDSASNQAYTYSLAGIASGGLSTGNRLINMLGTAFSPYNAAYWGFKNTGGTSSASNEITFGLFGYNDLIRISATNLQSLVNINPAADATYSIGTSSLRWYETFSTRFTAADGSQTVPTFRFINDTDTGLFRSGTDTLNFTTAGSEKARIQSDGNVGIGTTSPSSTLHVSDSTSGVSVLKVDGSSGTIFEVTDDLSSSLMSVNTIAGLPVFEVFADYHIVAGRYNQNDFYLSAGGSLGLGTASPNAKLTIDLGAEGDYLVAGGDNASNSRALKFTSSTSNAGSNGAKHTLNALSTNGEIAFAINNSEKAIINKDGSVGIGIAEPLAPLHVQSTQTTGQYAIRIKAADGSDLGGFYEDTSGNGEFYVKDAGGTIGVRLDSNGDTYFTGGSVGLGTTSPTHRLTLGDISTTQPTGRELVFYRQSSDISTGYDSTLAIYSKQNSFGTYEGAHFRARGFKFQRHDGSQEYLSINNDGNVGIGTADGDNRLHVNNAGGSNNSRFSRGGSYIFDLKIDNVITNSAIDYIIEPAQASSGLLFRSRNSSNTNINALAINRDGNVGVGTTNPIYNLDIVGSGGADDRVFLRVKSNASSGDGDAILYLDSAQAGESDIDLMHDGSLNWRIRTGDAAGSTNTNLNIQNASANNVLTLEQTGYVGIGTNNPGTTLHVYKNAASSLEVLFENDGAGQSGLTLRSDRGSNGNLIGFVYFDGNDNGSNNTRYNSIESYIVDSANGTEDGRLTFSTYAAGTDIETMHIMGYGSEARVGIGTVTPARKFSVGAGDINIDAGRRYYWSSGDAAITSSSYNMMFETYTGSALTEKLRIKGDGQVQFNTYGAGTFTGTATQRLAVDSSGNVIEIPIGDGAIDGAGTQNYIPIWTDAESIGNSVIYQDNGNVGVGMTSTPSYKLQVNGSFAATTKSFVIDHPTKPNKKLRYASLEGPENGVYVRGKGNSNVIELPEYWTELVHEESITVNLTAIGRDSNKKIRAYSVDNIEDNKVYIYTDSSDNIYNYFFTVYGERKDVERLEVEVD